MIRRNTFFLKIYLGYVFIIILLVASIFLLSFRFVHNHYVTTLSAQLSNIGNSITSDISHMLKNDEIDRIDPFIKELGRKINTRLTVIRPDGKVMADSEKDPAAMDNHRYREEIDEVFRGKDGRSIRYSKTVKQDMLYVALPIYGEDEIIGVVRASLFLEDINQMLRHVQSRIIMLSLVIVLIATIVAFFFSRSFFRPIEKLIHASHEVAGGNFQVRVDLKDESEIKVLADSFNDMAGKIDELFQQMVDDKEELDCVISSIADGLLVLSEDGKILAANQSFMNIIQQEDLLGQYVWEVFAEDYYDTFVRKVLATRKNYVEEINWGDEGFLCSVSYILQKNEIVLVFHNITEIQKLEKTKRDFISNVSHELRTPLTAIKGFLETLEDEDDEEARQRYVGIIHRHTERLINIVKDLLLLSNLEDQNVHLQVSETNLEYLVSDVLKMFEEKMARKELTVSVDIAETLPVIRVDYFKLEQLFINLIDNAIKYTDAGQIRISAEPLEEGVRIQVSDTGIGISDQHMSRLFERFYVVDKSRSRKAGGTGLGLSIVKHIVQLHQGDISVESLPGKGTTFHIYLPLQQEARQRETSQQTALFDAENGSE